MLTHSGSHCWLCSRSHGSWPSPCQAKEVLSSPQTGMISMKTGCSQDGIRFGPFYKEDDHRSAGGWGWQLAWRGGGGAHGQWAPCRATGGGLQAGQTHYLKSGRVWFQNPDICFIISLKCASQWGGSGEHDGGGAWLPLLHRPRLRQQQLPGRPRGGRIALSSISATMFWDLILVFPFWSFNSSSAPSLQCVTAIPKLETPTSIYHHQ